MGKSLKKIISLSIFSFTTSLYAADEAQLLKGPVPGRTLDGVFIEAVEAYPNAKKKNELSLGIGFYPFDAYYTGLSVNAGYLHRFNETHGWEIINGSYFFSFENGLTSDLAEKYQVNPKRIERLQYVVSTNGVYTPTFGKFVFYKEWIRYFTASAIYGIGLVNTSAKSNFAVDFGVHFTVTVTDKFSWSLDVRNSVAIPSVSNYSVFYLTTGYNF